MCVGGDTCLEVCLAAAALQCMCPHGVDAESICMCASMDAVVGRAACLPIPNATLLGGLQLRPPPPPPCSCPRVCPLAQTMAAALNLFQRVNRCLPRATWCTPLTRGSRARCAANRCCSARGRCCSAPPAPSPTSAASPLAPRSSAPWCSSGWCVRARARASARRACVQGDRLQPQPHITTPCHLTQTCLFLRYICWDARYCRLAHHVVPSCPFFHAQRPMPWCHPTRQLRVCAERMPACCGAYP